MDVLYKRNWNRLNRRDKEIIVQTHKKDAREEAIRDLIWVQKMMLQGTCILLNCKPFGFGRKRLTLLLGGWYELYRTLGQFKTRAEQDEYLATEMARIFKKHGFPYQYLEKLEKM